MFLAVRGNNACNHLLFLGGNFKQKRKCLKRSEYRPWHSNFRLLRQNESNWALVTASWAGNISSAGRMGDAELVPIITVNLEGEAAIPADLTSRWIIFSHYLNGSVAKPKLEPKLFEIWSRSWKYIFNKYYLQSVWRILRWWKLNSTSICMVWMIKVEPEPKLNNLGPATLI